MQETEKETLFSSFVSWMRKRAVNRAVNGIEKNIKKAYEEIDKIHNRIDHLSVADQHEPISEEQYFAKLTEYISLSCGLVRAQGPDEHSAHLLFWGYDHKFMERTFEAIINGMFVRKNQCLSCNYTFLSEVPPIIFYVDHADDYGNLTKLEELSKEHQEHIKIIKLPSRIEKGAIIIPPQNISLWDEKRTSTYPSEKGKTIYRADLYAENLESFELHFRLFTLYWAYDKLRNKLNEVNKK